MSWRIATTIGTLAISALFGTANLARAEPRRILVYGDSNTWGYVARSDGQPTHRYPREQRWTGLLQRELGSGYEIVEDGLNLRTTDLDGEDWPGSVIRPDTFNGLKHLSAALAAHMPLDLVVIMLGTNDLQARYQRQPDAIAAAAVMLARQVQAASGGIGTAYPAPKALLVSPVQIATLPIEDWNRRYAGGREKSAQFASAFQRASAEAGLPCVDAASAIGGAAHGADGLHLSPDDHRSLASALAPAIRAILGPELPR
ncbi:Lysophospholipase L1 [Methylobacterium phyllostachyos]|uniref:Lysophospholipase L1 n=1 Tax=Methylobacterium phyllostachyos TaxID=582672 RepID=A0A1H0J500_9HYPH|nr:GDSL-type esterase/lipase family protein [Methylobacterium phyllostachyos]SDO38520.1 Lysophospholipase L1 [Methylobacterium phyllostachyos]